METTPKKRGRPVKKRKPTEKKVPQNEPQQALAGKEEFLAPTEVERIKQEIAQLDEEIGHIEHVKSTGGVFNPEKMFAQDPDYGKVKYERRAKLQEILATRTPPATVAAPVKNKVYSRYRELKNELRDAMQSRDVMMGERKKNPLGKESREPYPGAVDREVAFQERYGAKIKEFQRLAGILEPHNPEMRNIERLRRPH